MAVNSLKFFKSPMYPELGTIEAYNLEPATDIDKSPMISLLSSVAKGLGKGQPSWV